MLLIPAMSLIGPLQTTLSKTKVIYSSIQYSFAIKRGESFSMNSKIFIGLLVVGIALAGCITQQPPINDANQQTGPDTNTPLPGSDRDAFGCIPSAGYSWCEAKQKCLRVWEEPCEAPLDENGLTEAQARQIAQESPACGEHLLPDTNAIHNEGTQTYWFDLNIVEPGCAPACVVSETDQNAEINWRCTGLVQ